MSQPYSQLAWLYDGLMDQVDYCAWAGYLQQLVQQHGAPGRRLLDLGCGTGSLTLPLAAAGFDVVGVDLSSDMLTVAADKGLTAGISPSRWLHQDMRCLQFPPDRFDIAVCACDGFNYLADSSELDQTLAGISRCLQPQGLLLFDVHSEYKMREVFDGGQFIQESEAGLCLWTSDYDAETGDCSHQLDIFLRQRGDLYRRTSEQHRQHYFCPEELVTALPHNGFAVLAFTGWNQSRPPLPDDERIQIVARRLGG